MITFTLKTDAKQTTICLLENGKSVLAATYVGPANDTFTEGAFNLLQQWYDSIPEQAAEEADPENG